MPVFWNYQFATHYPPESSPELVNLAFGNVKDITSCSRMNILTTRKTILALVLLTGIAGIIVYSTIEENVDFNAEIKPILNKKCISCHGGVRRQGDFSVLFRSEALGKTKSGHYGIVPGRPDQSEMIRRIKLKDPEERMPYQHQPLSTKEISLLTRWVKQGAQWGNHWAYVPVLPVEVPKPPRRFFGLLASGRWDWPRSDLDRFIYQKLQQVELQPGKEADKATLLRRVSLDLIGLPAPDSIAQKFLNKKGNEGYEELVDNLLASPRFGEKWTLLWPFLPLRPAVFCNLIYSCSQAGNPEGAIWYRKFDWRPV